MTQIHTTFSVADHGFRFVNSFTLPFPTTMQLPMAGEINLNKIVYGLCGGMCFAALDYFYANQPVPAYTDGNTLPHAYLTYLWERQLDSLGFVVIPRLIEWVLLSDQELALKMSRHEVPKLRRLLDQGKPAVLALVRGQGVSDPTINHQVLAIGYDYDETTRLLSLTLCDPNYNGVETSLSMSLANPSQGLQLTQSTGEVNRGLFVINYTQHTPPNIQN